MENTFLNHNRFTFSSGMDKNSKVDVFLVQRIPYIGSFQTAARGSMPTPYLTVIPILEKGKINITNTISA